MNESETLPFDTLPALPYRPGTARWLIFLGIVLMFVGFTLPTIIYYSLGPAFEPDPNDFGAATLLTLGSLVSFIGGVLFGVVLIGRGRRMRALPALELLKRDPRAPVLFLRSFDDDDLVDPTPRMVPLGDMFPRRYEESLVKPLHAIGPMISIGRPGNKLALLGGGRLFVPDHAWQTAIDYLRERAAVVVLMAGRSEGLWWEIKSSLESIPVQRLLFFFPYVEQTERRRSVWQRFFHYHPARMPLSRKAYTRMEKERQARYALFRERIQPLISQQLPMTLGNALFVHFLPDGTPRTLATVRPWWWPIAIFTPSTRYMIADLGRTLRPFVDKLQAS